MPTHFSFLALLAGCSLHFGSIGHSRSSGD